MGCEMQYVNWTTMPSDLQTLSVRTSWLVLSLSARRRLRRRSSVTDRSDLDVILLGRRLLWRPVLRWPDVRLSWMTPVLLLLGMLLNLLDPLVAGSGCPGQRVRQSSLLGNVRKPPPWQGALTNRRLWVAAGDRVLYCIELPRWQLADWPKILRYYKILIFC